MASYSLTPATEARLLELDADAAHLSQLDGPGAKHYLDGISQAMDCGPYSESEATALSDVEGMLAELDVERAALNIGLFDEYTEQIGHMEEMLDKMREAAERDRNEIERLGLVLEDAKEELKKEREGKGKGKQKSADGTMNGAEAISRVEAEGKKLKGTMLSEVGLSAPVRKTG